MTPTRTVRLSIITLILVLTAGCDQVTKHYARLQLGQAGSVSIPGHVVEFTLAENPGAFLSVGAALPQITRTALMVCVGSGLALLLAYLLRAPGLRLLPFMGLALSWSGGMSNLIDRFSRHGLVTDFMVLRVGPFHTGIFNLADFAIMAGTLVLVASFCLAPRNRPSSHTRV
jgi:signal peptidase II